MPILVRIPDQMRSLTGGRDEVAAEGRTIGDVLNELDSRFKGLRGRVCDDSGDLHPGISLLINRAGADARELGGLAAPVSAGDVVVIVAANPGGGSIARRLYLTFPQERIKEPIIFRVGHEFNVVTNIRGASVSDEVGLVALEIEGEPGEVERAIEWLEKKGVKVEPLEDEG